jgi:uncharacterized membrane protein YdjX (TVP38/TMEM64 family)
MKLSTLTRLLGSIFLFIALAIFWEITLKHYITLEYIQQHLETLKNIINAHYWAACIIFVIFYATAIVCMLSVTLLLTALAGFLFGAGTGTLLSITGALIGSSISFLTIRYLVPGWLQEKYHTQLEKFTHKFKEHGVRYILMLYFFPFTPYAVITTAASLSHISFKTFLWTTAVGIFPITVLCSFAGKKFATISSIKEILSVPMLLLLGGLSLITLLPLFIDKTKK